MTRAAPAAGFALLTVAGAAVAAPAPPGDRESMIQGLAATERAVFAVERKLDCPDRCVVLIRTVDGGRTWVPRRAAGWGGDEVVPVPVANRAAAALLTRANDRTAVSWDDGDTFTPLDAPGGAIGAAARPVGAAVVTPPAGGTAYVVTLPAGSVRAVPGTGLGSARITLHPAYGAVPRGQPVALAAGSDPDTEFPTVQACDFATPCGSGVVLASRPDVPTLHVSPAFARDGVVFASLIRGGLFRSSDWGRTFQPVVVTTARAGDLVTTVQDVAFSAGFDGSRGRGTVFAAVLGAGEQDGEASTHGGVYVTSDVGVTWSAAGDPSPLDRGASSLAWWRDELYAGYLAPPHGGLLCLGSDRRWQVACPRPERAPDEVQARASAPAPAAPAEAGRDGGAADSPGGGGHSVPGRSDEAATAAPGDHRGVAGGRRAAGSRTVPVAVAVLVTGAAAGVVVVRRGRADRRPAGCRVPD